MAHDLIANKSQIIMFALVGALGFLVDSGVLYIGLYVFDLGYYLGRLASYLTAATVAWHFHRVYTFKVQNNSNKKRQLFSFIVLNSVGGTANYLIYAFLVAGYEAFRRDPVLAVAVGALVGMFINYYLSKRIVFRE
jgi:putative flippase GtrA